MASIGNKEFDRQYAAAVKRGKQRLNHDPRAASVHYDSKSRRVVIDLINGSTLIVPAELLQGLAGAKASGLADVHILGPGTTLNFPRLDVQFSVTGLVSGIFGTKAWMSELERTRGRATSAGKRSAATKNGRLGHAPGKQVRGRVA
jgi:hypothetical protein